MNQHKKYFTVKQFQKNIPEIMDDMTVAHRSINRVVVNGEAYVVQILKEETYNVELNTLDSLRMLIYNSNNHSGYTP